MSNFFNFEQLLSNFLAYFLATFQLFRSRIWKGLAQADRKSHLSKEWLKTKGLFTGGGGSQIGKVTCGGSPHLSCKRDQINMRDYMDRRVTPPTQGPPPPCKQALSLKNCYSQNEKKQLFRSSSSLFLGCLFLSITCCKRWNEQKPGGVASISTNSDKFFKQYPQ